MCTTGNSRINLKPAVSQNYTECVVWNIGQPYISEENLTAKACSHYLETEFQNYVDDIPPHYTVWARNHLDEVFIRQ